MLYIVAYVILCLIAALLGSKRNLGFWGYLLLSFAITPVGVIVLLGITAPKS